MSGDVPFGFGSGDRDPDEANSGSGSGNSGSNPMGFGTGGTGDFDISNLGAALSQIGAMLQAGGTGENSGPVNWDLATDSARKQLVANGDPSVDSSMTAAVTDAVTLADLWLDQATEFPATTAVALAWSRSEWLTATLPAWQQIIEPIASSLEQTMSTLMPEDASALPEGLPPELAAMAGPLLGMAKSMGAAMFGMQVGQGLSLLAAEVVSSTDVGIPLTTDGACALVPSNIKEFSDGLELSDRDVMLFVALREAASQRLFAHVPWLRSRVESAISTYAQGIQIDRDQIEQSMAGVDVQNPEALQEALGSGVFAPQDTPEQKAALARLETLLALIEGWVDDVVDAAVSDRLPAYDRLRETLRRRRATGGPAEKTFATLVGLELRPRRLREAAALWQELRETGGPQARDALWAHPDLLPTADDLDDPSGFIGRTTSAGSDFDPNDPSLTAGDAPSEDATIAGSSDDSDETPASKPPADESETDEVDDSERDEPDQ